jgi:hypothetical protein
MTRAGSGASLALLLHATLELRLQPTLVVPQSAP